MNSVKINNFLIKEGDTARLFEVELINDEREVNLEGSSVKLVVANITGAVLFKTCEVVSPNKVQFKMISEDKLQEGIYDAEIVVIYPDEERETFPENGYMKLKVVGNLETRGLGEQSLVWTMSF